MFPCKWFVVWFVQAFCGPVNTFAHTICGNDVKEGMFFRWQVMMHILKTEGSCVLVVSQGQNDLIGE